MASGEGDNGLWVDWPLEKPSSLGTDIDSETGTEIGGPGDGEYASVALTDAVVGVQSTTTTGTILSGDSEILMCTKLFQ